jgi:hypothetical protein
LRTPIVDTGANWYDRAYESMSKSIAIALVAGVFILTAMSGCSVGDGTRDGCATALYGTYTGSPDGDGLINAFMRIDDQEGTPDVIEFTIEVTFIEPDDTPDDATDNSKRTIELSAMEDGTLVPGPGVLQLPNSIMDYDTCQASGDWDLFSGSETGTWEIGRYHSL